MESRYKIIISNRNLYKEIELTPTDTEVKIGTTAECTVRLRKELFFSPVELILQKIGKEWQILCSDNLYLTVGGVLKLLTKKLTHGDEFSVKYQESDNEVLKVSFMIDFDYIQKPYDCEIDVSDVTHLTIGGKRNADICFSDFYLGDDTFTLTRNGKTWIIHDNQSQYGVFVNGQRITRDTTINEYDFFSIVGFSFYYKSGKLYTSDIGDMMVSGLSVVHLHNQSTCFKYPKFYLNSRIQYKVAEEEFEIQQPPVKPSKPKQNLVMTLIPSIVMLAMTIVLRGVMGGGGSFVIYSAISMGLGIVMSVASYFSEKKEYKKDTAQRQEMYQKYINEKEDIVKDSRKKELDILNMIYESIDQDIYEVDHFGKRLFERRQGDPDYLKVYLGKGTIESANQVKYTKQEFVDLDDPMSQLPEQLAQKYRYIDDAPITSDFNLSNGIGVIGDKEVLEAMMKNMTLDISIRHFYNDVRMVYILDEEYSSRMNWIRWLHNVDNRKLGVRNIVCDEESRNLILEDLYKTLSSREAIVQEKQDYVFPEQYVVFVTNAQSISKHPVSKYISNCSSLGFTFVFFEEREELIPQGCSEMVRITDKKHGLLLKTENGNEECTFSFPYISDDVAEKVIEKLGAIQVDEVSLEGELTKNISMFEMLGILSVNDIDLQRNWESAQVYRSLAAPIGVKTKGQIVYLNISDKGKAHGPHGLVAGTTGSGKSELLQTYILSMATLYHPYEVGFVIIDFKGGGMANQFKDLPHLIGTITNIDGREIDRSLMSIKAELVKRQEMFSESGVNHINDYIKLYKAGKVNKPMPHLIMIVDEFAELKQEFPDFMKELVSAARIGRTLGIHLILATQKPAGVVDSQIWSNSKFKLCLKVQTKEDSTEVIKTPLAAEIVEPGRAYFQVGNNEIFELFQSAYSGANVPEGNENNEKIYSIYERNLWGRKKLVYTNKKKKSSNQALSQLDSIVQYVHDYCLSAGIEKLPGICLPSLKDVISTDKLSYRDNGSENITVPVGIYDDPELQQQGELVLDISKDNLYIVGSSQMGKTVLLQTIAYGLIRKYTPQQVNLYMIDCGSMVLKIFEKSNHVGGVVLSNEEEKCKNLFKLLNSMIAERKKILSSIGIGNYSSYIEAGYTDIPMAVVMIDNMAAFKEYFPAQTEEIGSLSREAQGVGICLIITSPSSNALSYRVQANFGRMIVLNCNDTNEYSSVLGHNKMTPKEVPGRGLVLKDKRVLEFQSALFGRSRKEAERSQELQDYLTVRNSECTAKAVSIPMVPDKLNLIEMIKSQPESFRRKGILPIGIDFETVSLSEINILRNGSLTLFGNQDCKYRFLDNLISMLSLTSIFHNIEMYVVDEKSRKLDDCEDYGFVQKYVSDASEAMNTISEFCEVIESRISDEKEYEFSKVLIINNLDAFRRVMSDRTLSKQFTEAMKNAEEVNAFIILACVENQVISFNSSEVLKYVKETRKAIFFGQLPDIKLYDMPSRLKNDASYDFTIGYRINGSGYSKIKLFE